MKIKTERNKDYVEQNYLQIKINGTYFRVSESFGKLQILKVEDKEGNSKIAIEPCVSNVIELS